MKKITISIADTTTDQPLDKKCTTKFVTVNWTIKKIYKHITDQGELYSNSCFLPWKECLALPSNTKKGNRAKEYFQSARSFSIDIDEVMLLEDALNHPFVIDNAAFVYTTKSHTKENNRFRVFFVLEEEITSSVDFLLLLKSVIRLHFPTADEQCVDVARFFFGNSNSTPVLIKGRSSYYTDVCLSSKDVRRLIKDQKKYEASLKLETPTKKELTTSPKYSTKYGTKYDSTKPVNFDSDSIKYRDRVLELVRQKQLTDLKHTDWLKFMSTIITYGRFSMEELWEINCIVKGSSSSVEKLKEREREFQELYDKNIGKEHKYNHFSGLLKATYGDDCFKGYTDLILTLAEAIAKPVKKEESKGEVFYLNGLPGAGKTTAMCRKINASPLEKFIIAVPSNILMDEYVSLVKSKIPGAVAVSRKRIGKKGNVESRIAHYVKNEVRVILITHKALTTQTCLSAVTLKAIKKAKYHLMIDEVIEPLLIEEKLKQRNFIGKKGSLFGTLAIFNKELAKTENAPMSIDHDLETKGGANAYLYYTDKNRIDSKTSFCVEREKEQLKRINNPLLKVGIYKVPRTIGDFYLTTWISPELWSNFSSITVLSAFFERSMLAHHFSTTCKFTLVNVEDEHPKFKEHKALAEERFNSLRLYYGIPGSSSKNKITITRYCREEDKQHCIEYFRENGEHDPNYAFTHSEYVEMIFNKEGCPFSKNKLKKDKLSPLLIENLEQDEESVGLKKWLYKYVIVPSRCFGVNCFDRYRKMILNGYYYPSPDTIAALIRELPGYDPLIERDIILKVQQICRTCLRDAYSTKLVHAFVCDKRTALVIRELLGGRPSLVSLEVPGFTSYTETELSDDEKAKKAEEKVAKAEEKAAKAEEKAAKKAEEKAAKAKEKAAKIVAKKEAKAKEKSTKRAARMVARLVAKRAARIVRLKQENSINA